MNEEDWINMFIDKFNESKDYKITDVQDREKLLDELRPKGKWIIEKNTRNIICSCCGQSRRDIRTNHIYFCNHCGAKMRGEEE